MGINATNLIPIPLRVPDYSWPDMGGLLNPQRVLIRIRVQLTHSCIRRILASLTIGSISLNGGLPSPPISSNNGLIGISGFYPSCMSKMIMDV